VLLLRLLQQLVVVGVQVVSVLLILTISFLAVVLLLNLLFDPVFLLQLLHSVSVAETYTNFETDNPSVNSI